MSAAVKRACDACHRRKVKCDGVNQCRNCSLAQLTCTYNAVPQKKGPKGSRAKVISELRETQRQTSLFARIHARMKGGPAPPASTGNLPSAGLLTPDLIKSCLDFYFAHMYTTMPILDQRSLDPQTLLMDQNRETYCLVAALCAFVMLQPGMTMSVDDPFQLNAIPGSTMVASTLLLEECIRVRSGYDYLDRPGLHTLAATYFIFCSYYGIASHERAWYYLREASSLMVLSNMDKEESYASSWNPVESARRRRLYWLVAATERAYGLFRNRPISLDTSLVQSPSPKSDLMDPMADQLSEFCHKVQAFQALDAPTLQTWTRHMSTLAQSSSHPATALQKEANETLSAFTGHDPHFGNTESNKAYLTSLLTSYPASSSTSSSSPSSAASASSSQQLDILARQFLPYDVKMDSDFVHMLLRTCLEITEAIEETPASRDPFLSGPREQLLYIHNILALIRNGHPHYLPLVLVKMTELLSRVMSPMLLNAPENVMNDLQSLDMFDGFGNPALVPPLPLGQLRLPAVPPPSTVAGNANSSTSPPTLVSDRKFSLTLSVPEYGNESLAMNSLSHHQQHHHHQQQQQQQQNAYGNVPMSVPSSCVPSGSNGSTSATGSATAMNPGNTASVSPISGHPSSHSLMISPQADFSSDLSFYTMQGFMSADQQQHQQHQHQHPQQNQSSPSSLDYGHRPSTSQSPPSYAQQAPLPQQVRQQVPHQTPAQPQPFKDLSPGHQDMLLTQGQGQGPGPCISSHDLQSLQQMMLQGQFPHTPQMVGQLAFSLPEHNPSLVPSSRLPHNGTTTAQVHGSSQVASSQVASSQVPPSSLAYHQFLPFHKDLPSSGNLQQQQPHHVPREGTGMLLSTVGQPEYGML